MIGKKIILTALSFAALALVTGSRCYATDFTVTTTSDDPNSQELTLRQAIGRSAAGDRIVFAPSLNGGQIVLNAASGTLQIDHDLTISGPPNGITIDAAGRFGVVRSTSSLNLSRLTVKGGHEQTVDRGGGIQFSGNLILTDCQVNNNYSYYGGGGIRSLGTADTLSLLRTTISNNVSGGNPFYFYEDGDGGGGGVLIHGSATVAESTIASNNSIGNGGGIFCSGILNISNSIIDNNNGTYGGGIYCNGTCVVENNCRITNNIARDAGAMNCKGALSLADTTISGNGTRDSLANVSAVYHQTGAQAGSMTVKRCTFTGNNPSHFDRPTALFNECYLSGGTASLEDSIFSDNESAIDHSIRNGYLNRDDCFMSISNCQVSNRPSGASSTGILILGTTMLVRSSIVSMGTSAGIYCHGKLTMENSSINNCPGNGLTCVASAFPGWPQSEITVNRSTISGNGFSYPGYSGIQAYNNPSGDMIITIDSSTVSGNRGDGINFYGGGAGQATLAVKGSTITNNTRGLYIDPRGVPRIEVDSSIIAQNTNNIDVTGSVVSDGYNVIGAVDGSSGWIDSDQTGDISNPLDAMLGPLADNGGETQTHALLDGSPAIGAGDPSLAGTLSQNGVTRPSSVDAGSYQTGGGMSPRTPSLKGHVTVRRVR